MTNIKKPSELIWKSIIILSIFTAIAFPGTVRAQKVLQLVPGQPPLAGTTTAALNTKPGEALRIENLIVDDKHPSVVHLELHRSEVVGSDTQYVVVDGKGARAFPFAGNAHFIGGLEGKPESYAFATITPDGEIRAIIHRDNEVIVNELLPAHGSSGGKVASRLVDHHKDFVNREFSCGVTPTFLQSEPIQRNIRLDEILKTSKANSSQILAEKADSPRRADIIIDSDYELYQKLGSEAATFTYITNLLTYISSRYQTEVATRFNLKQILIRTTSADPWSKTTTGEMLDELQAFWNSGANASVSRHHVHLMSGKNIGGGIAYVGSLASPTIAYGVSAGLSGNFTPSNPQVIWDSVVVAHEIGHAFGSSHTHDYDNPFIAPSPNNGGAIDCCFSGDTTGQCGISLGGAGRLGYLPGISSISGGGAGQRNGTIMSYCHLLNGSMGNIAWTFGTSHPYGVNPDRVPAVMSSQAQSKLPLDTSGTFPLAVGISGTGTVTSSPAGINCGIDCNESYAAGTTVMLSATAGTGYTFSGWSGDCTGNGPCSMTMNVAKNVMASFVPTPQGVLSIAKVGTGSGTVVRSGGALNCGNTCTESLPPGSIVTLTATPANGSTFTGWSGDTCTGTGSCSFTVNANTTVNAQFNLSSGGSTSTPLLQSNLSGSAGSTQYFSVAVPAGAINLVIQISGGTGDSDLYVKLGQVPTLSSYDCRPYLIGNIETCTLPTPAAGTYHIMLTGYEPFSGLTLAASYQMQAPPDIGTIINLLLLN
ncbi:pre-peptidase C-terminal domain-containing protein [Acidovorax sp. sif1233]|uniref:M12 family metallo-peptidase n=1 Tax=Acidovorax sp. sif1233 TaxID=2854792 RepID=UPI001C45C05B|nr:M12 family metallo-peptidase [Acidovorax sp. sif1233]MBV7453207.1 pre-peptidase C-terminal domain-containing protein [Acidovorax sp. sif1233]